MLTILAIWFPASLALALVVGRVFAVGARNDTPDALNDALGNNAESFTASPSLVAGGGRHNVAPANVSILLHSTTDSAGEQRDHV